MPPSEVSDRNRRPPRAALVLLLCLITAIVIVLFFFADPLLNRIVQNQLREDGSSNAGPVTFVGKLHVNPWTLAIECDSLALRGTGQRFRLNTSTIVLSGIRWYRIAFGSGFAADEIAIRAPRLTLPPAAVDTAGDGQASAELPSAIRPLTIGRLSVADGALRFGSGSSFDSLSGTLYDIAMERLPGSMDEWLHAFGGATFTIGRGIVQNAQNGYRYGFSRFSCNTKEGFLRVDSLTFKPGSSDSAFFAVEKSRTSRFIVSVGNIRLSGFRFTDAQTEGRLYARSLLLDRVSWSILIDKRKPSDPLARPRMPNEILSTMERSIGLDTVRIRRSLITYGELFSHSSTPALLHWSNVEGTVTGISNRSGDTTAARIRVSGSLMDRSAMLLSLRMPLSQRDFSLTCSGSAGAMNLDTLNPWLEISDRTRVTGGRMEKADFSFEVQDGRASGVTVPLYSGLTIATLSKESGSSKGAVQAVKSLLANVLMITNANPPKPGVPPKEGKISYVRKPTDPFFGYLWHSLRTGLASVVGFSEDAR